MTKQEVREATQAALRRHGMSQTLIDAWQKREDARQQEPRGERR